MSAAGVYSLDALRDLRVGLSRYQEEAEEALRAKAREIAAMRAYVDAVIRERRQVAEAWQLHYERCRRALDRCLNDSRDRRSDCREEQQRLAEAARELTEARAHLATATEASRRVEAAVAEYEREARHYQTSLRTDITEGITLLRTRIAILEGYADGAGVYGPPTAAGSGPATAADIARLEARVAALQQAEAKQPVPAAVSSPPAGGVGPAMRGPSPYVVNGRTFADVPLDQIESVAFAPGEWEEADTEEMRRSFARLPEVRRAIAGGTISDLCARDADAGRVFDWFFGDDAVRLEPLDGVYTISGGRHRVTLARMLNLTEVPAAIVITPRLVSASVSRESLNSPEAMVETEGRRFIP